MHIENNKTSKPNKPRRGPYQFPHIYATFRCSHICWQTEIIPKKAAVVAEMSTN